MHEVVVVGYVGGIDNVVVDGVGRYDVMYGDVGVVGVYVTSTVAVGGVMSMCIVIVIVGVNGVVVVGVAGGVDVWCGVDNDVNIGVVVVIIALNVCVVVVVACVCDVVIGCVVCCR